MRTFRIGAFVAAFLVAAAPWSRATPLTIAVGDFVFTPFIPGSIGTIAFDVDNFTGPNALPPDFAVADAIVFQDLTLILDDGSGARAFAMPNLGPGNTTLDTGSPLFALQFPSTATFASALLQGRLVDTSLRLDDGSVFSPFSLAFSVGFTAAPGDVLGDSLAAILVDGDVAASATPVPEPSTLVLVAAAAGAIAASRRKRSRRGL